MRQFADESSAKVGAALFEAFAEGAAVESTWDDLLKHRVCLLVVPAHCGKTSELKLLPAPTARDQSAVNATSSRLVGAHCLVDL